MNDRSDGEPSIYETLPGGPELLRWFGRVPTFHDAEILSLTLNRRGESLLRLHAWLLLSGQGPEARLELAKPAVVTFILKEIMDLRLEGFSPQNVIYGLVLRRAPDPYGRLASDPRQDCVEIELRDCYGLSGRLLARSVGVAFRPGNPTAEDL